jgi:hypothetical protein
MKGLEKKADKAETQTMHSVTKLHKEEQVISAEEVK